MRHVTTWGAKGAGPQRLDVLLLTSDLCVRLQFSLQMDLIRQQLEFEVRQVRSVMEERFGTSDEMVHRTQVRLPAAAADCV